MRVWVFAVLVSFVLLSCQAQKVHAGWGPCPTHDWLTGTPYGLPGTGFDVDEFLDEGQEKQDKQETQEVKQKTQSHKSDKQNPPSLEDNSEDDVDIDTPVDERDLQDIGRDEESSSEKELKVIGIIFAVGCVIFMYVMSTTSETGPRR